MAALRKRLQTKNGNMRDFLQNDLRRPMTSPRLNTQHRYYDPQHLLFAGVANGDGSMTDLVQQRSQAAPGFVGGGFDESGPYCAQIASTTAGLSFTLSSVQYNYFTMGMVYKRLAGGNTTPFSFISQQNGYVFVSGTLHFVLNNGGLWSYSLTTNNVYYLEYTNAVATSGLNRSLLIYNLTSGIMSFINIGASADNVTVTPLLICSNYSGAFNNDRIYAAWFTASQSVPPTVANPPLFPSRGSMMEAASRPWSLWYS
jgi:hypothetical protein